MTQQMFTSLDDRELNRDASPAPMVAKMSCIWLLIHEGNRHFMRKIRHPMDCLSPYIQDTDHRTSLLTPVVRARGRERWQGGGEAG